MLPNVPSAKTHLPAIGPARTPSALRRRSQIPHPKKGWWRVASEGYPQDPKQFLIYGLYLESYKVIPKRNYLGGYGYGLWGLARAVSMPDVCRILASSMGLHVRRWQVRLAVFLQWTLGLEAVRRPIAETVQGIFDLGFRV